MTYPCQHCGECPVWLAAYNHPSLQTDEAVINACITKNCPLVGMEVSNLDVV